jgi:hypothetical protein
MAPLFPQSVLNATRVVVLTGKQVGNPPFYAELVTMGLEQSSLPDFSSMAAITFVDIIVFHQAIENRTLFHELVACALYALGFGAYFKELLPLLGLPQFAANYVNGFLTGGSYMAIPLEQNAYELDERFAGKPGTPFSVEEEVQDWIDFDAF